MAAAVVFDVDGTLVTFRFDVRGTRSALIADLATRGFDTSGVGLGSPTQEILESARRQIVSGTVSADFREVRASAYRILDEFEEVSSKEASLFPEAPGVLKVLRDSGVPMAVLTNSGRKATDALLQRTGLTGYFEFVLTRDDTDAMKPRPDGLVLAIARFRKKPEDVYYVGDSALDVAAAKLAGVRSISVTTGNYSAEKLKAEGAEFVIGSMADLPGLLGL